MKIAYRHLVQYIEERPSIEHISNKLFQLGHEHEIDGDIFDMEFTPNRGDCLSVNGLLRDLAVFYTIDLNQEIYTEKLNELQLDFENHSESICSKISFLKLEIDQVPGTYKNSLDNYFIDLSLNKNNFFTDVSNYLSYETGQPTHCYDAYTINNKLVFHEIEKNEEFETLLGKKITLTGQNAVFSLNNDVINLAGVVGGKSTSCSVNTKTVIVECAFFQPEAIIGKSVKYDIQSEASHKFERGVDPECHDKVLRRFIKIVSDHTNIKDMSIISFKSKDNPIYQVPINVNRINQIIGINLSEKEYLSYLLKLGFVTKDGFVEVPSFRSDIKTQNDLAEEVARVVGYDNIAASEISIPGNKKANHKDIENKLRFYLLDHGFYEVINSPFVSLSSKEAIKVDNPLDSNREYLRTNITNSLVENLLFNERRQKDSIKLFEISDIYSFNGAIHKKRKLSLIASGRVGLNYEDFSKKINIKYISSLFQEILPNQDFDFQLLSRDALDTKINNEIVSLEVNIDAFAEDTLSYSEISQPPRGFNKYSPISELPSSFKDISYSIKDFSKTEDLQVLLLNYQNDIIKYVYIFDYFYNQKKQEVKIGFRFIFQSQKLTLTSAEIDIVYNDIINKSLKISGVAIPGIEQNT
ncbi:phenylalanine--tRNA ligase beta subunit-related protein [Gammaproteobacteria bacterium]|nr:phenylalanine--tRNA ligase beta subunit-related protein [Gammaproteobacteria bacterium]